MRPRKSEEIRLMKKYNLSGEYAGKVFYLIAKKGMNEEDAVREFLRWKAERQAFHLNRLRKHIEDKSKEE